VTRLLAEAALGGAAGFGGGLLFFLALRRNVALYLQPGPAWRPAGLHLARFGLLAALLLGAAMAGAMALLAALGGLLLARRQVLRGAAGRR
jgi:hypothetical protein